MKYLGQESETADEALERQRQGLQSVTALRDELAESAPAKMMKGFVTVAAVLIVVYWVVGRR